MNISNYCILLTVGFGRRDIVELLLAAGASIQAHDDGGLHPLHNACSFGHEDVVGLLLEAGADPNTRDNWNYTPLHEAAVKGKFEICIGKIVISFVKTISIYYVRTFNYILNSIITTRS